DTLRLELVGSGIHVSLIEPGPIESKFRENAHRMFQKHIDSLHSVHRQYYQSLINRLEKQGPAAPFTLPAEAVLEKVIHALQSSRPKPRYHVTFPTHLFALLRRLLSSRAMDRTLLRVGGSGRR
ncbi:MAG: short-chain dehydrogenase, partial [Candidatus Thiodiazotropha sp.]